MKNKNTLFLALFTLLLFCVIGCKDKSQDSKEQENSIESEVVEITEVTEISEKSDLPEDFKSLLRPNEKIELGKIYSDTINYVEFNDGGDDWYFIVEKNKDTIGLIYNKEQTTKLFRGNKIEINWKIDSIRYAGDPEFLNFKEFLTSYKKIGTLEPTDKNVKFLWRETQYNKALKTDISTIVLNEEYIKGLSKAERAALAYVATFIGNECEWNGYVNDDRSNLKCKIIWALDLDYQCSQKHLDYLKSWFRNDDEVLKKLDRCPTKPDGATVQNNFNEITIHTETKSKTILVTYKVTGVNMRENETWSYTQADTFKYTSDNISLIHSDKKENDKTSNSTVENNKSFVISCGSGCAMTYTENTVVTNNSSHEVKFKVEMHVNEVLSEEYYETYIFKCGSSTNVEQIKLKGDDNYKIEDQHPEIQEHITSYANQLCI
jgi:hypothetical protein